MRSSQDLSDSASIRSGRGELVDLGLRNAVCDFEIIEPAIFMRLTNVLYKDAALAERVIAQWRP
jgi:hypothetical protein